MELVWSPVPRLQKLPWIIVSFFLHECIETQDCHWEISSAYLTCFLFYYYVHFILWFVLGSPVLGYLAAGILIGPYGLSIICHVHGTKAIAEFGVVFLLFNIGLEVLPEISCQINIGACWMFIVDSSFVD